MTPRRAPGAAAPEGSPATRDRLTEAALQLFARQGFGGTTVGDIEEAAGLTARGGGFYRHFASKDAALAAVVDEHIRRSAAATDALHLLPFGDLRSELTLVCRWLLAALDDQRSLIEVIDREGDRFPELRDRCRRDLFDAMHRAAVAFTGRWAATLGREQRDAEASAVIMIGAALSFRRSQWTFGSAPLGVDDERFVTTWVQYCYELLTGDHD